MVKTVIKITISVITCVISAALLFGGVAFAKFAKDYYTLDFDNYEIFQKDTDGRITYPRYVYAYDLLDFDIRLMDCYIEVQDPCESYATAVAYKYNQNADLTFTVENTGKLLTIEFTGTGYPENGKPEPLERTYIFDIDGANVNKLPKLVNRADFIGY